MLNIVTMINTCHLSRWIGFQNVNFVGRDSSRPSVKLDRCGLDESSPYGPTGKVAAFDR
jgi:hypothetical protein